MANEIGNSSAKAYAFSLGVGRSYVDVGTPTAMSAGTTVTQLQIHADPTYASANNTGRIFLLRDNGVNGSGFPIYEVVGYGDISEPLAGSAMPGGDNPGRWRTVAVSINITTSGDYREAFLTTAGEWSISIDSSAAPVRGRGDGSIPTSGSWTNSDNYSGNAGRMLLAGNATMGAATATLSSPTPSGTLGTATTATLGATTNQISGTLYGVLATSAGALSGITGPQIKAGLIASGSAAPFSGSASVGTSAPSIPLTGQSASTTYYYAEVQENANGFSNIVTGSFTTAAASATPVPGIQGTLKDTDTGALQANQTGMLVTVRTSPEASGYLDTTATGTTDANGLFQFPSNNIGSVGSNVWIVIRNADYSKVGAVRGVVVDLNTSSMSF